MIVIVCFVLLLIGYIYIGNSCLVFYNWLFVRKNGGWFILCFDDIDLEWFCQEYVDFIDQDFCWLGIEFDIMECQLEWVVQYDVVVQKLKDVGLFYFCYEMLEEFECCCLCQWVFGCLLVYDCVGLKQIVEDCVVFEVEGCKVYWWFVLFNYDGDFFFMCCMEVIWIDLCCGDQVVDLVLLLDFVLIWVDGIYFYMLLLIVDDIDMGVIYVIWGEDYVVNIGVQIVIFKVFGVEVLVFGYYNLLIIWDGEGFFKCKGVLFIGFLWEIGFEFMCVCLLVVLIGISQVVEFVLDMEGLVEKFDFISVLWFFVKFDLEDFKGLNVCLVYELLYEVVQQCFVVLGVGGGELFWFVVCGNCVFVIDV